MSKPKWKDGTEAVLKAGMRVTLGKYQRKIMAVYPDIVGGVRLDRPVDRFVSWNSEDLMPKKRGRQ